VKLRRVVHGQTGEPMGWAHFCPGCKHEHVFYIEYGSVRWTFDGNLERPTFKKSMLVFMPEQKDDAGKVVRAQRTLCHYHLVDGVLHFCKDSPHFAGKKVALPDLPAAEAGA
jgi:hypothetical protein